MDETVIAQDWLDDMSFTAAVRDLDAHMDLVSKSVQILGVPGKDVIDFRGWSQRRRNEFRKSLLFSLTYKALKVQKAEGGRITFDVQETMKSTNGDVIVIDKEITLVKESHDRWRAQVERIKNFQFMS